MSCLGGLQQELAQAVSRVSLTTEILASSQQDPAHPLDRGSTTGLTFEQHESAEMLLVSLSSTRLSSGQQDPGHPALGGRPSKRSVSEQEDLRRPVSTIDGLVGLSGGQHDLAQLSLTGRALSGLSEQQELGQLLFAGASLAGTPSFAQQDPEGLMSATTSKLGLAFEQHESAQLVLGGGSLAGFPSEQQDLEHLPLMEGSLAGLSLEQQEPAQATVDDFLADFTLSLEPLRWRRRFCAASCCVPEPLLLRESSEVRRRERADDFLEHFFPSSEWRSRISQQVSWPRAMRARQMHPRAWRVAP